MLNTAKRMNLSGSSGHNNIKDKWTSTKSRINTTDKIFCPSHNSSSNDSEQRLQIYKKGFVLRRKKTRGIWWNIVDSVDLNVQTMNGIM
jgi:hypothetical protein